MGDPSKATYKAAGVDLEKYADAMQRLPKWARRTFGPRVRALEGGFAGVFRLDFAEKLFARRYEDPMLVACTDGVGTKLLVAGRCGRHDTIGIDLVAMCVNDAICCGAEPLFFLDYVAMAQDNPPLLESIVEGISQGCLEAECALIGGETAIMPDLYEASHYDLAGFCVGVVESRGLVDGSTVCPGDAVLGLASTGFHANGYSLLRKVVFETARLDVDDVIPGTDPAETVGECLLRPTALYVKSVRRVLAEFGANDAIRAIAHVTGGGIAENLGRVVPSTVDLVLRKDAWPVPAPFAWLQRLGDIDPEEMFRVFNMGIGMALVVDRGAVDAIRDVLAGQGVASWGIGTASEGQGRVHWEST